MAQVATYKNKSYTSRSQCALAMLADGLTQREVANYLGISDQAVSATRKRLAATMFKTLSRAKRQADEAVKRSRMLNEKVDYITSVYTRIVGVDVPRKRRALVK